MAGELSLKIRSPVITGSQPVAGVNNNVIKDRNWLIACPVITGLPAIAVDLTRSRIKMN
jgi:hypothetical protein